MGQGENKTQKQMEILTRKSAALNLRLDGYSYQQIYDTMLALESRGKVILPDSYDKRYVYRDINSIMDEVRQELVESGEMLRAIELRNCDRLQNAIMGDAMAGNLKAIDRVLKIMNQRAKYVPDLIEPKQIKVSSWQDEILELIKAGKITVEDVKNVYPGAAEQILARLPNGGSERKLSEGSSFVEGEYVDLGSTDEEVSGEGGTE